MPILRFTHEVTLLLGAIVIVALEGAAAVRGDRYACRLAFSEAMIVAIEYRLEIEITKLIKHGIRVRRTISDTGSEREMCEQHRWLSLVQPGKIFPQPFKRGRFHRCLLIPKTIRRIQPDELPAPMMEVVIHAQRKCFGVSAPICLRDEVVVAHHWIHRAGQHAEDVLYCLQIFALTLLGHVAGVQAKFGVRLLHLRDDAL